MGGEEEIEKKHVKHSVVRKKGTRDQGFRGMAFKGWERGVATRPNSSLWGTVGR